MQHVHKIDRWEHSHVFLGEQHKQNERKTWLVISLTAFMMVAEILGGSLLGSMALVADGWHMSTHAAALAISAFAYTYARRHKNDERFVFGTGKLGDLAGFTSAIILSMIAVLIVYQAIHRIMAPVPIAFGEAIPVACLGLAVNVASVWLLHSDNPHPGHHHEQSEHHNHAHHHDNNLRSAYLHVIADAATSILAIVGLIAGWLYGWIWMDAIMGIIGSLVIISWSYTLIRSTGRVLLDVTPDEELTESIRETLQTAGDLVTDLHMWQIGTGHYGAIISLVTDKPQSPAVYKNRLTKFAELSHITVEVHPCPDA